MLFQLQRLRPCPLQPEWQFGAVRVKSSRFHFFTPAREHSLRFEAYCGFVPRRLVDDCHCTNRLDVLLPSNDIPKKGSCSGPAQTLTTRVKKDSNLSVSDNL